MQTYEVEVKALLGGPERAEELRRAMKAVDPSCTLTSKNKQLNHYFEIDPGVPRGGSLQGLSHALSPHISDPARAKLDRMASGATKSSLRTRKKDDDVYVVVKASVDDTTSENGIARIEFEERVALSLDELDRLILKNGFKYQAKWSREREEYVCIGINVTLDKNAGYGWLAEFERVVDDDKQLENARKEIRALMSDLAVEELAQVRLERMFAHYNAHWPEYYGTEKIFVVE